MVGKIEEINLRAVSIFTTAQLTAVPPYYSVDTSVDSVDSTMPPSPLPGENRFPEEDFPGNYKTVKVHGYHRVTTMYLT